MSRVALLASADRARAQRQAVLPDNSDLRGFKPATSHQARHAGKASRVYRPPRMPHSDT